MPQKEGITERLPLGVPRYAEGKGDERAPAQPKRADQGHVAAVHDAIFHGRAGRLEGVSASDPPLSGTGRIASRLACAWAPVPRHRSPWLRLRPNLRVAEGGVSKGAAILRHPLCGDRPRNAPKRIWLIEPG